MPILKAGPFIIDPNDDDRQYDDYYAGQENLIINDYDNRTRASRVNSGKDFNNVDFPWSYYYFHSLDLNPPEYASVKIGRPYESLSVSFEDYHSHRLDVYFYVQCHAPISFNVFWSYSVQNADENEFLYCNLLPDGDNGHPMSSSGSIILNVSRSIKPKRVGLSMELSLFGYEGNGTMSMDFS